MSEKAPIYCDMCGFPVWYCQFRSAAKQKEFGCYAWLKKAMPELHAQIYPPKEGEAKPEAAAPVNEAETQQTPEVEGEQHPANLQMDDDSDESDEIVEDSSEDDAALPSEMNTALKIDAKTVLPFGLTIKPHIKKRPDYIPILQIRAAKRGTRKWVTQIWNYVDFPQLTPKETCSALAKQFAAASGITTMPDGTEDIIAIQGKFVLECIQFLVGKCGVPRDQIYIAPEQKHQGKKKVAKHGPAKPANAHAGPAKKK